MADFDPEGFKRVERESENEQRKTRKRDLALSSREDVQRGVAVCLRRG